MLPRLLENMWLDAAARRRFARPSVRADFARHVVSTVPRYQDCARSTQLSDFPLLQRTEVSADPDRHISTAYRKDTLILKRTSGTTGVPLQIYRDPVSMYVVRGLAFRDIFDFIPELATACDQRFGSRISVLNDNPRLESIYDNLPCLNFGFNYLVVLGRSEAEDIQAASNVVSQSSPILHGRARGLLRMADLLDGCGLAGQVKPRIVLAGGDNLYESDRRALEARYGVPVYNCYGSEEAGICAVECEAHEGIHALHRVTFEVLLPDGHIAEEGTGELVITSLQNWAMPFIRYRTGDSVVLTTQQCACGRGGSRLLELQGRVSAQFNINGRLVNPALLNKPLEALPLRQFQVVQDDVGIEVFAVARGAEIERAQLRDSITRAVTETLGVSSVDVSIVDAIPTDEKTLKIQRYINRRGKTDPARVRTLA